MLLRSKLFIVSGSPSNPMPGDPNVMLGIIKVLRVFAASQQTLFIVSGFPSNPFLEPNAIFLGNFSAA